MISADTFKSGFILSRVYVKPWTQERQQLWKWSTTCHKIVSRMYNFILQAKCEDTLFVKKEMGERGTLKYLSWELEYVKHNCFQYVAWILLGKRHEGSGCWRLWRINNADHFHIFWNCQIIVSYWQEIHEHINNVFGVFGFRCDSVQMGGTWIEILLAASEQVVTRKRFKSERKELTFPFPCFQLEQYYMNPFASIQ